MAWPRKKIYGAEVDPSLVGSRQIPSNPASKSANGPIQVWNHARNGKPPVTPLINGFCEAANQAILYRTKENFHYGGAITGGVVARTSGAAGDRARWRFAFHTSPYTHALMAVVIMHPQSTGFTTSSKSRIDILNGAGSVVGSATFTYGANPDGTSAVTAIAYAKVMQQYIDTGISPDTDYTGVVYDVDYGRVVSCSVFELQSMTEFFDGYMPMNITAESSILDVYRQKLATIINGLWTRGGATVFNWTADVQASPRTNGTASAVNIIDGSSTTYGSAIPGYELDMTGKARLSQTTGVPVRMQVYAKRDSATATIDLRDSAGVSIMSVTPSVAADWQTVTGVLPTGASKYYLTSTSDGIDLVYVYAVSVYEYE